MLNMGIMSAAELSKAPDNIQRDQPMILILKKMAIGFRLECPLLPEAQPYDTSMLEF
jgi:hypothetical protein